MPEARHRTKAGILLDPEVKTLKIRLHTLANPPSDHTVKHLCAELKATELKATEPRSIYELASSQNLCDQKV